MENFKNFVCFKNRPSRRARGFRLIYRNFSLHKRFEKFFVGGFILVHVQDLSNQYNILYHEGNSFSKCSFHDMCCWLSVSSSVRFLEFTLRESEHIQLFSVMVEVRKVKLFCSQKFQAWNTVRIEVSDTL